jgi:hypothetical protein
MSDPYAYAPASPTPRQGASGFTAITAVVLSLLGVLWHGVAAIHAVQALVAYLSHSPDSGLDSSSPKWSYPSFFGVSTVQILIPLFLLVGAIQLLMRNSRGCRTIRSACFLILIFLAVGIAAAYVLSKVSDSVHADYGVDLPGGDLFTQMTTNGLVLVVVPAASRSLR